jgi:alginate O-acetyltransferase complex protein AlgI
MQFNSFSFLLLFAAVLAVHNSPLTWRARKFGLLIASYLFYAAWNPPFVLLLWGSTLVDWFVARALHRTTGLGQRRGLLFISLGVNLGALVFFKYGGFLLENFVALSAVVGVEFHPAAPDIVLPVGISFYTFQTLSYTLDIYRNQARPWHSFLDYALYVTFFPQLVAGPIVRSNTFLPQCEDTRRTTGPALGLGLALLVLGLFMKIVIADGLLAPVVERVFDATVPVTFASGWFGTVAFAGQIFCDFAGYSTCAIGIAMSLGFTLPRNFHFPYAATGLSNFWTRWHISLSTWLRDYLYISLGGSRRSLSRTQINLMITMLIGGLWHGASWTFVVWGGLHGLYLVVERPFRSQLARVRAWPLRLLHVGITFFLVCIAWVFFRAVSVAHAMAMLRPMLTGRVVEGGLVLTPTDYFVVSATMSTMLVLHFVLRDVDLYGSLERLPWWMRSVLLATMLFAIITMPGEDRAFIYFQF